MRSFTFLCMAILLGCQSGGGSVVASGSARGRYAPREERSVSLFPSDAAVLPDDAIGRILDAKIRLPQSLRIALLHIEHHSAGRYLGWGPCVREAASLPTFLLPEKPTVGHLREAAARFQVDAVFIFRTDCEAYDREHAFRATEVKAYCTAESALLDVRSGVVPYTDRTHQDFELKQGSDESLLETMRAAEATAFTNALEDNARGLVLYLDRSK
jgi:hypothetical protein